MFGRSKKQSATKSLMPRLVSPDTPCVCCGTTDRRAWRAEWYMEPGQDRPERCAPCGRAARGEDIRPQLRANLDHSRRRARQVEQLFSLLGLTVACPPTIEHIRRAGGTVFVQDGRHAALVVTIDQADEAGSIVGSRPAIENGFATVPLPYGWELRPDEAAADLEREQRSIDLASGGTGPGR